MIPKSIAKKLNEVKSKVGYLDKDGKGYNYKYVTPENVLSTFNPILLEVGLNIVPTIESISHTEFVEQTKNGPESRIVHVLKMNIIITDVESGECAIIPWFGEGENGTDKGFGSGLTYGLRYWFLHTFQIPTGDEDPDARRRTAEGEKAIAEERKKAIEEKTKALKEAKTAEELSEIGKSLPAFGNKFKLTEEEFAALKLVGSTRKLELAKLVEGANADGGK